MPIKRLRIFMVVLLIALSGCATRPEYQKFAKAGIEYAVTLPPLLALGCKSQVDSSSWGLILDRADTSTGKISSDSLDQQNMADKERCDVLGQLSKHANLLGKYFAKLNELSSTEVGTEIGGEIDNIFGQVQTIGAQLRGTPLFAGTPPLGEFATLAVNLRINAALRSELERRQITLQEEFYTQEVLLRKLSEQINFAQEEIIKRRVQIYVEEPLVDGKWLDSERLIETRRQQISGLGDIAELAAAGKTAKTVRETFDALISGKLDSDTMLARIDALIADIATLRTILLTLRNQ